MHCMSSLRLFYLYEETMQTCVKEDSLFTFLNRISPTVAVTVVSVMVGRNVWPGGGGGISQLSPQYSWCAKSAIRWEDFARLSSLTFFEVWIAAMSFVGLAMHIAIFRKLRQIESQPMPICQWVVSFNNQGDGDVDATRRDGAVPSQHVGGVWRHRRNVISPMGSFATFVVSNATLIAISYYLGQTGPSVLMDILIFLRPCQDFFVFNFIETLCSPTLGNTFMEFHN